MTDIRRKAADTIDWKDPEYRRSHGLVTPPETGDRIIHKDPTDSKLWREPNPVSPRRRIDVRSYKKLITEADDMEPEWGQG